LAVLDQGGAPLIVSAGSRGALRSWRADGTPGPLPIDDAHPGRIRALAVALEHDGAPLIVSADSDGALRGWPLDGRSHGLRGLQGPGARQPVPLRALARLFGGT
jgi:hypothetical protein